LLNGTITVNFGNPAPWNKAAVFFYFADLMSPAMDQSHIAASSGNSVTSGSAPNTTQSDEVLIGAAGFATQQGTMNPGSGGYALLGEDSSGGQGQGNGVRIDAEYRHVSSTGSYAATGTDNKNTQWAAAIVTYKKVVPKVTSIVKADS